MNIYIYPDKVWQYAVDHDDELEKKMVPIADDYVTGAVIYVSSAGGITYIIAEVDDEFVEEEEVYGEYGARRVASEFFEKYFDSDSDDTEWENMMVIEEREEELNDIIFDFLDAITDGTYTHGLMTGSPNIQNMKEKIIDFLCQFDDVHIYRPMYVEDPEEEEPIYAEFPYDMYDFVTVY